VGVESFVHLDIQPHGWSFIPIVKWLSGRHGRPAAIVVAVLLAVFYILLGDRFWSRVRNTVFDVYQLVFPRQVEHFPVVIVDIDDASLAALGRWPWPRTRLARLIETTHGMGARVVGLDIIMPEADTLSPDVILAERLDVSPALRDELAKLPSNDAILAEILRRTPSVVARAGIARHEGGEVQSDWQTPVRMLGDKPEIYARAYEGHFTNVPPIEAAATGRGYLDLILDVDGVVRTMPLLVVVNGKLAPTLGLEMLRVAEGKKWYEVYGDANGIHMVQVGQLSIPTDPNGSIRLYYSPSQDVRRVSALAVLRGEAQAAKAIVNKLAIIGVTGLGLSDIVTTPVDPSMDGVEIQAQVIENIREGIRLVRPSVAPWLELLTFLVTAAVLILLLPVWGPSYGMGIFLGMAMIVCAGGLICFVQAKLLFDPLFPTAGNALILVVLLTSGFAAADRQRREVEAALEVERLERIRISGELQAAHKIQMGMLPAPGAIERLPGNLEFHALLEPAEEVGGDLYDAFMLNEYHFFFLIGDVSGKGVPASLFMALSKTLCKSAALREHVPLDVLIRLVNEEISRENPESLFVTAVIGIIDVRTGEMELCNAGNDAPILLRTGVLPYSFNSAGGPPLCVWEDFPYPCDRVQLQSDDTLILITDGVTEAQDPEQNFYGLTRALAYLTVRSQEGYNVASLCQGLYEDVKRFTNEATPSDDITIMAVRFRAPHQSAPAT
jgi:adenylate cyclase